MPPSKMAVLNKEMLDNFVIDIRGVCLKQTVLILKVRGGV